MDKPVRPVVLVTGGAKRTGLVIAEQFAGHGYDVAIHYRSNHVEAQDAAAKFSATGATARTFAADLNDARQIQAMVDAVFQSFGRLDVLVNCASVFFQDHLKNFELEDFDEAWRVNCRAPILLTRAFHDHAVRRRTEGAVINVVDQKVKGNFHPDHFSYTVAKTAIGHLTAMLAVSCRPTLRVNAVFPGLLLPSDDQTEQDFEYAARMSTPLGYAATPVDLAQAALELTQPRYNGSDLVIEAGQNLIRVDQDVIYKYKSRQ